MCRVNKDRGLVNTGCLGNHLSHFIVDRGLYVAEVSGYDDHLFVARLKRDSVYLDVVKNAGVGAVKEISGKTYSALGCDVCASKACVKIIHSKLLKK